MEKQYAQHINASSAKLFAHAVQSFHTYSYNWLKYVLDVLNILINFKNIVMCREYYVKNLSYQ